MRPVQKGDAPGVYKDYNLAKKDLRDRIGLYCSYCEMPIINMPAVEHVIPVENGGSELEWENFLLSCQYCNSNKKARNMTRDGYFWPDIDNTFLAFIYLRGQLICPAVGLSQQELACASETINLYKLDREPLPNQTWRYQDTRWFSRNQAWSLALESLNDWEECQSDAMARCITKTAVATGHFSIWMKVFENVHSIRHMLIQGFPGTAQDCFDENTQPVRRIGGNI